MTSPQPLPLSLQPAPEECLVCFLQRVLDTAGCDGTIRLAELWCRSQPNPTGWVRRWLQSRGGFCDCEILMNAFENEPESVRELMLCCPEGYEQLLGDEPDDEDEEDEKDEDW